MLSTVGFREVYSMEGGIRAWEGLIATGAPEAGMAHFPEKASAEELIVLAWLLEKGSRRFYSELPEHVSDKDAGDIFQNLVVSEQRHMSALADLYGNLTGKEPAVVFSRSLPAPGTPDDVMEGGVSVSEALAWVKGRSVTEALELAMALETNSYDLYIKMGRKVTEGRSKKVFSLLASGEKNHLERLAALLDKKL